MWKFTVLCVICVIMTTQAVSPVRKRYVSTGSYAGGGASAGGYAGGFAGGYGGGYGGGFAGTGIVSSDTDGFVAGNFDTNINNDDYDDYDPTDFGYAPDFGLSAAFLDPYVFHQQLTAQIQAQHAAQQKLIQRQAYWNAIRRRNPYSNKGSLPHRYAPNYAAASGSIGPGGYYQTAYISPSSSGSPNIVNRFSSSSTPGGYKGVSVSSYSSSADVDGKRTGVRGAQTTVNDNGKITTYSTHS